MIPIRNIKRFLRKGIQQPWYALSVLRKRLKARRYYLSREGESSPPEAITLFLTHRCNLQCSMCGQWGEGGVTRKQGQNAIKAELTVHELRDIIDDVSACKPNITLFGGEPLLHRGCLEIINYIKRKKLHCLMITNGSLLNDFAEGIVDSGLDELNLSLDGGRQLHDQIRGMEGLFEKIMEGLKKVQAYKKQKKKKRPLINLQCTVSRYNYMHLEQLLEVADQVKADSLTYHNLIFIDSQLIREQKKIDDILHASSVGWEGFVFDPGIDPQALFKKMHAILSGRYRFNVDMYPNFSRQAMMEYYRNPAYKPAEYPLRCLSPWIVAYIFPDGEVRPCLNSTYAYGNIRKEKFMQLWNSQDAVYFRKMLKTQQAFPACVRCTELYRY